jgi:hypothetical protein
VSFVEPRVSGAVLLDQHRVMEEIAGKDVVKAAMAKLDPEQRSEYESLLPVSWCSVTTANAVVTAVARECGRNASALQAEVVRVGVERTLKSIWRIILRFTWDDALISRTPMIYSKTYDRGELKAKMAYPGRAEVDLVGWPTVPQLDIEGLATGIETVLRVAGRRDVKVNWERRPGGVFYVATWRV